ncbi:MAG: YicC family protein [Bacteroidales bacterium]|nr:YicC family protein [Bacteroidales bacterium]
MSIISMTGFGKSESNFQGTSCVIEVRSVNSRFLEISSRIPKNFAYLENDFKKLIKEKLSRGSVNFSITLGAGSVGNIPVCYNEEAIGKFVDITKAMQTKFGIAGEIKLEHVLSIPEVLQFTDAGADNEAWEKHLTAELSKALDGVNAMREKEGANLALDLERRVKHLNEVLDKVEVLDPKRIDVWKEKFRERINGLMKDTEIDEVRLLQEACIMADKLDIHEEITRFRSHNKLFLDALAKGGAQGKNLGFILQEMGREANTLGTKCQSADIAALAIELKNEIECIREQSLNIA